MNCSTPGRRFVSTFLPVFDQVVDQLPGLASNPLDLELLAATIRDEDLRTAFRYLAAPPVSEDDLKTLADSNLAPTTLRTQRAEAERVNLGTAQFEGLTIYWNDRLNELVDYIASTRG